MPKRENTPDKQFIDITMPPTFISYSFSSSPVTNLAIAAVATVEAAAAVVAMVGAAAAVAVATAVATAVAAVATG
jgi:hypothetical protein